MSTQSQATREEVQAAAHNLGFTIPPGHGDDYLTILGRTDAHCQLVLAQPDYKPLPNLQLYPRADVHLPDASDNPLRAWAWRCHAGDPVESAGKLLSGKTVVFKDTVCMAEVPLLFGTDAFEGYIPDVDATVVSKVLESGGHVLGKAACENFSQGATSSTSPYGPVENPYATGFTTGGSSSGCGALIASGEVDMGIGGDQGGSVRIPASFCGIVALKPTFGLVPYTGILTFEAGLDHVGPMARTVYDCAALLQAVAGYDRIDDRQLGAPKYEALPEYTKLLLEARETGVNGMKIGVLTEVMRGELVSASVRRLVEDAADRFKDMGATVEDVSVPMFDLSSSISLVINAFGSGATRQGRQVGRRGLYVNDFWEHLLPWSQDKYDKAKYYVTMNAMRCEYGWAKYPMAYGRAMNLSRRFKDELDAVLEKYDVIIMPTCPQPARRHPPAHAGPLGWAHNAPGSSDITAAFNLTGHPAMSIPIGFTSPMQEDIFSENDKDIRLPVGMMIVGKCFDEPKVMAIGDAWEQAVDWKSIVHTDSQ